MSLVLGEEDELAEVVSQPSLVGLEALLASVFAAMVNIDADGFGEFNSQSNRFDFGEGESLAESGSMVVSDSLASH